MNARKNDEVGLALLGRSGELQAVADEIGDVLDVRFLVVMCEDDGVFLFLQPVRSRRSDIERCVTHGAFIELYLFLTLWDGASCRNVPLHAEGSGLLIPLFERVGGENGTFWKSDEQKGGGPLKVLKKGPAMRVIFFYPGEEGTYVDNATVTLFENGIVHIASDQEESTTHLQNCEILWQFPHGSRDRRSRAESAPAEA